MLTSMREHGRGPGSGCRRVGQIDRHRGQGETRAGRMPSRRGADSGRAPSAGPRAAPPRDALRTTGRWATGTAPARRQASYRPAAPGVGQRPRAGEQCVQFGARRREGCLARGGCRGAIRLAPGGAPRRRRGARGCRGRSLDGRGARCGLEDNPSPGVGAGRAGRPPPSAPGDGMRAAATRRATPGATEPGEHRAGDAPVELEPEDRVVVRPGVEERRVMLVHVHHSS